MRKKRGRKAKNSKATDNNSPDWFDGPSNKNNIHTRSQGSVREVQHGGVVSNNGNGNSTRRRSQAAIRNSEGYSTSDGGIRNRRTGGNLAGNQEQHEIATHFTFTLQQLHDSLSKKTLEQLLTNQFKSEEVVTIKRKRIATSFPEDELIDLTPSKQRTRRKRTPTKITPSHAFDVYVTKYKDGQDNGNAEATLGIYFKLYLKLFGEEDPQWNGVDLKTALASIRLMANNLTDGNYRAIIVYISKIMPLWKMRLVDGQAFPNSRPTVAALFGGKRHFWANRKVYYTQWQKR